MIFRFVLMFLACGTVNSLHAQEKIALNNQDGIYVSYELTSVEEGTKKDTYLLVLKAENKNNYDVFYSVPLFKQANGKKIIGLLENKLFTQSTIQNSTSLFGDNINLMGNETKLVTNDDKILFSIPKGSFVTAQKEFKVKSGVEPIVTNTFLMTLKKLEDFDLSINEGEVNGNWTTSCGNAGMTLTMTTNAKNEVVIQQVVNGKENTWVKTGANSFAKTNDKATTLVYNKKNTTFTYTTTDAVSCIWKKD